MQESWERARKENEEAKIGGYLHIGKGSRISVDIPEWKTVYGEVVDVWAITYLCLIDGEEEPSHFAHGMVHIAQEDDENGGLGAASCLL